MTNVTNVWILFICLFLLFVLSAKLGWDVDKAVPVILLVFVCIGSLGYMLGFAARILVVTFQKMISLS